MKVEGLNLYHSKKNVNFSNSNMFQNFKTKISTVENTNAQPFTRKSAKDIINIIPDSYADEIIATGVIIGAIAFGARNFSKLKNTISSLVASNGALNDTVQSFQGKMERYIPIPEGVDISKAQALIGDLAADKFATKEALGAVNGMAKGLKGTIDATTGVAHEALNAARSTSGKAYMPFVYKNEIVNGVNLSLADLITPIENNSAAMKAMNTELRSQSALSILGLRSRQTAVEDPFVRIVSVELKPFTSVGGMATVPKEIAEELPKILNKKNGARLVLDTPMYTGTIAQGKHAALLKGKNGEYIYRISVDGKPKNAQEYAVRLVDEMEVPIVGEKAQKVRLFQFETESLTDEKALKAWRKPFNDEMRKLFTSEQLKEIDAAVNTNGVYHANGYRIERLESGEWVYRPKMVYNLWQNEKFDLEIPITAKLKDNYTSDAKSSDELERFVFFGKYIYEHTVAMLKNRVGGRIYLPGIAKTSTTQAVPPKAILGADAFILNDWHTGPIAAMFRLSTIAKKYQQNLDPEVVKKAVNMPIMSVLHNSYDNGRTGDAARIARFFNIMFDENAAKVVPQAYMPNVSINDKGGLSADLWNGLMQGRTMSPLKMLATYSDSMHPVSTGYAKECAKTKVLGKDLQPLYKLRTKEGLSERNLTTIMDNNGINTEGISKEQIMQSTFYGITNGSNKANNILSNAKINEVIDDFYAPIVVKNPNATRPNLIPYSEELGNNPLKALEWKMHNKAEIIELYKGEIATAQKAGGMYWDSGVNAAKRDWSELHVWLGKMTSLEGVTVKTPFFVSSGRITQQKGYETYMEAIKKYYMSLGSDIAKKDAPVFIIQGPISYDDYAQSIVKCVENTKQALLAEAQKRAAQNLPAEANALKKAADRIVLLDRGDGGKYSATKILTDGNIMASNYEPCGLTHKEFGITSGGITIGNKTGGIPSGLDGVGSKSFIGVDFEPSMGEPISPHVKHPDADFAIRGERFSKGIAEAIRRWDDQMSGKSNEFAEGVAEMLKKDFTWAKEGNAGFQYAEALRRLGGVQ